MENVVEHGNTVAVSRMTGGRLVVMDVDANQPTTVIVFMTPDQARAIAGDLLSNADAVDGGRRP